MFYWSTRAELGHAKKKLTPTSDQVPAELRYAPQRHIPESATSGEMRTCQLEIS